MNLLLLEVPANDTRNKPDTKAIIQDEQNDESS